MIENNSVRVSATISSDVSDRLDDYSKISGLKKSSIINASLKQFLDINNSNVINSASKKINKIILVGIESLEPKKIPFFCVGEEVPNNPDLGTVSDIIISDNGMFFYVALKNGKSMGRFGPITNFTVSTTNYVVTDFK